MFFWTLVTKQKPKCGLLSIQRVEKKLWLYSFCNRIADPSVTHHVANVSQYLLNYAVRSMQCSQGYPNGKKPRKKPKALGRQDFLKPAYSKGECSTT